MGFLKNIFGGDTLKTPVDLSVLKTDVHSHFIPGIDDGAENLEQSIELVRAMSKLGYKKVITTPHIMGDTYRNSAETILPGLEKVRAAIKEQNIPIEIEAAAEYYIDADLEEKIDKKEILSFSGGHVLFEMPFIGEPQNLHNVIFKLQLAGYKPVFAHVERYQFWHQTFNRLIDMKDKGVILQVNISSFTGHYSPQVKKVAERLAEEKMIDLIGSDCHHMGHINLLEQARLKPFLKKTINDCPLINASL